MTKHSYFQYTSYCSSTPRNTNIKHNINHILYTNIQHTSTLSLTTTATQQTLPQTPTQSLQQTYTNMRHIHTSFVSRHLAPRGNNKILRTLPPHIRSSEEILPRLTCRTFVQLRTNKSLFLKVYIHKVDTTIHPSPLFPFCNTHAYDTHHLFNCTRIGTTCSPLDLWTDPTGVSALLARWTEKLAGGPQAEKSDSPPLASVMGVGRQHLVVDGEIVGCVKILLSRILGDTLGGADLAKTD